MENRRGVDGLAGVLLRCAEVPGRIEDLNHQLDRYCHRLRNRLNILKLSLYLSRRLADGRCAEQLDRAEGAYRQIAAVVDQLQAICNPVALAVSVGSMNDWIAAHGASWRAILATRGIRLTIEDSHEAIVACCDRARLGQAIEALVREWTENGRPGSIIRMIWGRRVDRCFIQFEGGEWLLPRRGESARLGFAVAGRVLAVHRGVLAIEDDDLGSTTVDLSWPAEAMPAELELV